VAVGSRRKKFDVVPYLGKRGLKVRAKKDGETSFPFYLFLYIFKEERREGGGGRGQDRGSREGSRFVQLSVAKQRGKRGNSKGIGPTVLRKIRELPRDL